jgi:hypothetical protein
VPAAAAADGLPEGASLDAEAAAAAGRGQEVPLDEERAHQARPEEHERDHEEAVHLASIGTWTGLDKIRSVSWLYIALLAAAVAVFAAAEWPRIETRLGPRLSGEARRRRQRERRKASLRVVQSTDADDFAASVERDLANLPTIDPDRRRR